jgi:hypothetical protein
MTKILDERYFAHVGSKTASLRIEDIAASQEFRKMYEPRTCRSSTRRTGSSSISSITR